MAEAEEREQIVKDGIAAMKEKGAATTPEAKAAVQQKLDAINERADNHAKMLGERAERRSRRPVDSYGGRRRKTRKGKKSRKVTRRKQRGGSKYGAVGASFQGSGSRGMINVVPYNAKGPSGSPANAAFGAFNDNGAHPGGNHDSFIRSH